MYTLKGFALKLPQPPAYPPGIPDAVQPDVSIFYLNSIMTQPLDGGGDKFLVDSRGFQ